MSVDKILRYLGETILTVLVHSTICFSGFYETKFGISFVYLSLWLLL